MVTVDDEELFAQSAWHDHVRGARYRQLARHIQAAIEDEILVAGRQLPTERELARLADVSRVTVRKAIAELSQRGLIDQRQGSGTFVRDLSAQAQPQASPIQISNLDQPLSRLTSFTEYMEQRGFHSSSRILAKGLFIPTPEESLALGLGAGSHVARIRRLRFADQQPMAIETSSLPTDILPNPDAIDKSLYSELSKHGRAPVRAVQRLTATEIDAESGALMPLGEGRAVLRIERTGYLESGRPIEWTTGFYRGDAYNFVAELRIA